MKKGDIFNLKITGFELPNKGFGFYEDKKINIKNVIPGQTLSLIATKKIRNKIDTKILEVVEKASYEIEPLCSHVGICGGCLLQTMPYEMQLDYKEKYVKGLLDKVVDEEFEFQKLIPSPKVFGYRNKMEFSFGDEIINGPLTLGMHMRGRFYEIITTDNCKIIDTDFTSVLSAILNYCLDNNYDFYHRKTHIGLLRHLVIRKAEKSGELLVNLVTSSQGSIDDEILTKRLLDLNLKGKIKGIINTINDSVADIVQSDEVRVLYGDTHITEEILGLKFDISPFSFFQTNSLGAEKLYSVIRDYIGETKNKTIFDLYSGTGTIAQVVAPVAKKVIGIEIVEEAVIKARENAEYNNLKNCEFIAGDVLKKVDELSDKPDIIILDPPRSGINPKAMKKIIDFKPDTFIYVSCNPKMILTDIPLFIEVGYKVEKAVAVDMFPHTGHVEAVTLLTRSETSCK